MENVFVIEFVPLNSTTKKIIDDVNETIKESNTMGETESDDYNLYYSPNLALKITARYMTFAPF